MITQNNSLGVGESQVATGPTGRNKAECHVFLNHVVFHESIYYKGRREQASPVNKQPSTVFLNTIGIPLGCLSTTTVLVHPPKHQGCTCANHNNPVKIPRKLIYHHATLTECL